jgi:hypothetical protein
VNTVPACEKPADFRGLLAVRIAGALGAASARQRPQCYVPAISPSNVTVSHRRFRSMGASLWEVSNVISLDAEECTRQGNSTSQMERDW